VCGCFNQAEDNTLEHGSEPNLHVEIPVDNAARFTLDFENQNGVRASRTKVDEFAEAFTRLGTMRSGSTASSRRS